MSEVQPLSDAELDAIRQRVEKATPGPWQARSRTKWGPENVWSAADVLIAAMADGQGEPTRWNADFIAHARDDVERLIHTIDELRADLEVEREWARNGYPG